MLKANQDKCCSTIYQRWGNWMLMAPVRDPLKLKEGVPSSFCNSYAYSWPQSQTWPKLLSVSHFPMHYIECDTRARLKMRLSRVVNRSINLLSWNLFSKKGIRYCCQQIALLKTLIVTWHSLLLLAVQCHLVEHKLPPSWEVTGRLPSAVPGGFHGQTAAQTAGASPGCSST